MLGVSYLKKIFRRSTSGEASTKAVRMTVNDNANNETALETIGGDKDDKSSVVDPGATIPRTDQDRNDSGSKILGKRKREHKSEGAAEETGVKGQQPAEQNKECTVCLELGARTSYPDTKHSANCGHRSDVCLSCWNQHVESEIRSKDFEGISCLQCSHKLVEEEVRRLTTESTYAEYLDKGAQSCMQQDEEFQSCPSANCPWGAFFAKDAGNIFNCQMCKLRWCLSCDVPFHDGQSCEEHLAARLARQQAEAASSKATRVCPKCRVKILRSSGCDHMTCKCGHQFCWLCFAPYLGRGGINAVGNSAHQASCKHASRNLPNAPPYLDDSDEEDSEEELSDGEDLEEEDMDDDESGSDESDDYF